MKKSRMRQVPATLAVLAALAVMIFAPAAASAAPVVIEPGPLTLATPYEATHWSEVWDLTQGDLTLSYTIDMNNVLQPGTWQTYNRTTLYAEVGLRGEGAQDFNPGWAWDTYQGSCGGYMVSDDDTWNDSDGFTESGNPNPDGIQDLDDKHSLSASPNRGERDYDVLLSDPDTVLNPTIGSYNNEGIWWDRDGVDPWQSTKYANTDGIYDIVLTFHAIDANGDGDKTDDGLGVVFATVNGLPQGFYADPANWDGTPDYIPAGLSFKGDMEHMQVFAGVWGPNSDAWAISQYGLTYFDYGSVTLSNMSADGVPGVSDPLVPDFTANFAGATGTFDASATHGGMDPYTYQWDWNNDGTPDESTTEPVITHTFASPINNVVKLTVAPFRCMPKSVTKYQWTLRKDVLLYWQGHNVNYSDPTTEFTVNMYQKDPGSDPASFTFLREFAISESAPVELWLATGEYKFVEVNLPPGYTTPREYWSIVEAGGPGHRDTSIENLIHFDLAVDKTGPTSAHPGDVLTYDYAVTNAGPAAVTPVLSDDHGTPADTSDDVAPTYVSGDLNGDGKIQADETWTYTATTYTVPADAAGTSIVNVVTVKDAEDDYGTGWKEGGDTDLSNNTDSWTVPVTSAQTGYLLPTQTTVQMYAGDPSLWPPMYSAFTYTLKSGKINSVSPGVIFYYNTIKAPSAAFTLTVNQTNTASWKPMLVQKAGKRYQAYLYDATTFAIVSTGTSGTTGNVTFSVTGATPNATYYIGIKYSPSNLVGFTPTGETSTYSFKTAIGGVPQAGGDASIPVMKK